MFIVFEGLDGSGSTTQAKLLAERLEKTGRASLLTKEPTDGTPIGKMIREILQHKWSASPESLQLLFCADRAEHLRNIIVPALTNKQMVICDRYVLSTLAYGGMYVDIEWLHDLNKFFIQPDLTFLLQLEPSKCLERITGRGSDIELFETKEKMEKIWRNYHALSERYANIHPLDADRPVDQVAGEIWEVVSRQLHL